MRNLSIGATLSALLIVTVLLWGALSRPAVAQSEITFGFAVDGSGLIVSSALGEEVGAYLEKRLSLPVKVRSFTTEAHLYNWLARFREVDVAWLSSDFLKGVPAGELLLLSRNLDHFPRLFRGNMVAYQGLNVVLAQQLKTAFLGMNENSDGRALLSKLEVSRFVSPTFVQTRAWEGSTAPQHDPARLISPKEENALELSVAKQQTQPIKPSVEANITTVSQEPASSLGQPVAVSDQAVPQEKAEPQEQEEPQVEPPVVSQAETVEGLPLPVVAKEGEEPTSSPEPKVDSEAPIALVADYLAYNSEEDSYEAKGDVVLRQDELELKSDELLWQSATQDAAAQGSVFLNDAGAEVSGERLQYNMATGQGQVSGGRVFVREGNFHLTGEQIEKHGQMEYSVKNGSFTTCDGEIPDWKFSASEVDATLGGFARAKNVWFHVKDVPVFYLPYMAFPVKTERESGFMTPSFGYSNNDGAIASLAWYQVIDRNMDATVYLDYISEVGLGKGLEYRYALAGQNNGEALYYHATGLGETPTPETLGEMEDIPDLYYVKWAHRGKLPGNWRLMADIEYAEQELFFEEYGNKVGESDTRDKTVSTLMLVRNWQKLNLVNYARFTKDFETNNDNTLQRLPEMGLHLSRYRLSDTPFYVGLDSYATRFQRDEGEDGGRLYLNPSLSAVFKPGAWLEVVPTVSLYERLYNTDTVDDERFVPEVSLALATRLVKAFDVNRWGIDRIQHSVEPKVIYTYAPDEHEEDLPNFDLFDRVSNRNDITYALVNRLVARSTAADGSLVYRDLFNLRLSQRYYIDEKRNNRVEKNQHFEPVRIELDFQPTANLSLNAESLIPVYGEARFNTLKVGASVKDDMGNSVRVGYSYNDIDFSGVATDYVKINIGTSVLAPVYVNFEERYDFQKNRDLEKVVGLEYRSKCWSLFLTYRDRFQEFEDNDQELMFTFALSGLGMDKGFVTLY